MGSASSMLTQSDIEEVQEHCEELYTQQEIVSLYERFCQLDVNAKGFISADEFLSVPEFARNPFSQRLLQIVDGMNFKDFVAILSAFNCKATLHQKIAMILKVCDSDCNGKVTFNDEIQLLYDLAGSFISEKQILSQLLHEASYNMRGSLLLNDLIKVMNNPCLKMEMQLQVD